MSSTSALVHSSHSPWPLCCVYRPTLLCASALACCTRLVSLNRRSWCPTWVSRIVPPLASYRASADCPQECSHHCCGLVITSAKQVLALLQENRRKPLLLLGFECRTETLVHSHPSQLSKLPELA